MLEMWGMREDVPKELTCSIRRWKKHLIPYEITGNKATQGMPYHHFFLLAIFKEKYPQASNDWCAVFIAYHSHDNAVFTGREISKAPGDMEMTRKMVSMTACQAFTPKI